MFTHMFPWVTTSTGEEECSLNGISILNHRSLQAVQAMINLAMFLYLEQAHLCSQSLLVGIFVSAAHSYSVKKFTN